MALQSHIYPDAAGFRLKSKLAEKYGVTLDQIVLGNGSDEIIMLIGETFVGPDDEVVMPHPSFTVYKTATLSWATPVEMAPRMKVTSIAGDGPQDNPSTKVFVLCNPNNRPAHGNQGRHLYVMDSFHPMCRRGR
jgi:histidinol-phosphate aminotransferase